MSAIAVITLNIKTKADAQSICAQIRSRLDELLSNAKIVDAHMVIHEETREVLKSS